MKKNYLLPLCFSVLSFVFAQNAGAQVKKGDVLLGGNVNFSTNTSDPAYNPNTKTTSVSLYPSVGKAIKDNLVVGFNLVYSHLSQTNNSSYITESKQDNYGAGVFVRRYKPLGSGFAAFLQGDLGFNYIKQKTTTPSQSSVSGSKSYNINAGFDPGIAYAISKHVQIETGFQNLLYAGYSHAKSENYDTTTPNNKATAKSHGFNIGTGLSSALQNFIVGFRLLI